VRTAGDVNGDGYSDVIVGASKYDNGQTDEGRAYVYHGSADGLSASADWTAESDQGDAQLGDTVGTAGDVNGDGYADAVVGAFYYDDGQTDEGKVWVYHGSADGLGTSADWTAEGNQYGAYFGSLVGTAGDVNGDGDGYSDVVVGASKYDNGQADEGRAYVYHGSADGLSASPNWTAEGNQYDARFGATVGTAGDVNGDGYADMVVGTQMYDSGQTDEGKVWVYHGSADGLGASADWTAEGNQTGARLGTLATTAGDVNGDSYADLIVGAQLYDNNQTDEGRAFVYYGNAADGLDLLPRQMRTDGSAPIAPGGMSDSATSVQLALTGRSPLGREKVRFQWQVAPYTAPFTSSSVISGTSSGWTDVLTTGVVITETVTGLTPETPYHWRARLVYRPGNRLGQHASRWVNLGNSWRETHFRTPASTGTITTTRIITYTYDPLNRLTAADHSSGESFAYEYDGVGNRTVFTQTLGSTTVTTYTYDTANRLTAAGNVEYTWDAQGNLIGDGTFTYAYNAAGRMVRAESVTATLVYTYNAAGLRVAQSVDGEETTFAWDTALPLAQVLASGSALDLYGLGRIGELQAGEWAYPLADALGSARQWTGDAGSVDYAAGYTPYGQALWQAGSTESAWDYTGEWWDADAELLYLRARWYDVSTGRFTRRDPWEGDPSQPISLQPYLYTSDNPLKYVDPTGTKPIEAILGWLRDKAEACYEAGDLGCVWDCYWALANGGSILGYQHASRVPVLVQKGKHSIPISLYW
jgi:RHS repeat-associated protein